MRLLADENSPKPKSHAAIVKNVKKIEGRPGNSASAIGTINARGTIWE
jgi:hypothetical protein